jgi:5-methyltetrahydrofolate--homocysteine methyltransferase
MTSAILNPCHEGTVAAIKAADILNGVDPNCTNWIKMFREPQPEGEGRGGRGGREGRRRRD